VLNEQSVCSTRLSNCDCQTVFINLVWQTRFDNGLNAVVKAVVKPVWQPVWQPAVVYRVYKHSTSCQTGLTTGLTTGWMFVYMIQPVVKPVVQLDWQPVVSCKRGFRVLLTSVTYTVCLSLIIVIIIIMIATDKRDTALADQINSMITCKTAKSLLNSGVIKFRQYKCFKFLKFFF